MTKEDKKETFGTYLLRLRESREMSIRGVEEKIIKLFPEDKHAHLSYSHLNKIEKDVSSPPSPAKLRSLAKIYGENYKFMLYKAGYLDENPFSEPKDWNAKTLRDLYFENITRTKSKRPLTEDEKRSVEKVIENVIVTITGGD